MTGIGSGKPSLTVVAAASTASHGSARQPLPCPGRPTICRRDGCSKAATDETIRLCDAHFAVYETDVERSQFILERAGAVAARSVRLPEAHATPATGVPPTAA